MHLNPYLFFNGNCEEALKFYEQTLGAKIEAVMKYGGSPSEKDVPPDWKDKLIHSRFSIGDTTLMASDAPPEHFQRPAGFSVSISVDDAAKGEKIFNALAENGTMIMPYQATFWAKGFGMCFDRFGIPWMVNSE
ncbi:MAG TPA: VOC family protein [Pyrinomonadaceae bacterium]